jgi:Domain of unknown function (DUF4386)
MNAQATSPPAGSAALPWGRVMGKAVNRTRAAAVVGLLSIAVQVVGFLIHGYPDIGASGKALAHWATITNQQQFAIGIYIEGVGGLLFLVFAAWLWTVARDAEGGSGWLATAGFSAAALSAGLGSVSNAIWSAVLDAGRAGAGPQTLAGMRDITQHIFETGSLFDGVFFVLIGYVLFRTRALPRWVGAVTAAVGLAMLIPPLFIAGILIWIWPAVLSLYLLIRPGAVAVREP